MATRLPVFDSRVCEDLALLGQLSPEQLTPVAEQALRFLVSADATNFAELAANLKINAERLRPILLGLASAFWDCVKARLSTEQCGLAMTQLGISPERLEVLTQCFNERREELIGATAAFSMALPEYQHLDWRIDIELGRRTVNHDADPTFMLRLDLHDGKQQSLQLQADYANMKRLQKELETAVAEVKTAHSMRFQRYIV